MLLIIIIPILFVIYFLGFLASIFAYIAWCDYENNDWDDFAVLVALPWPIIFIGILFYGLVMSLIKIVRKVLKRRRNKCHHMNSKK